MINKIERVQGKKLQSLNFKYQAILPCFLYLPWFKNEYSIQGHINFASFRIFRGQE